MRTFYKYILLLLCFCFTSNLDAQFSLKVGYNFGRVTPDVTNGIIQRFNENNSFYADPLEEFKWVSGFDLGVRYKNEYVAAELSWGNKYNRQFAEGTNPVTNADEFREVFLRYGSYSFGLESIVGSVGFGSSIDLNRVSFRTRDTDESRKSKVLAETGFSSNFFLSYHLEASETTSFTLRPYVQVPWKGVNIFELEEELNPEFASTANRDDYVERYLNFGIQIIFFNGY